MHSWIDHGVRRAIHARALLRLAVVLMVVFASSCSDGESLPGDSAADPVDILTLNFENAPDAAGPNPLIAVRVDGSEFAVAASTQPSAILIFDGAGQFLRSVAQRGMGPGELGQVVALAFDASDSLWVFGNGRVDIFDQDFEFGRSISLPLGVHDVWMAPNGSGVLVSGAPSPGDYQVRVRMLAPTGGLTPLEAEQTMYLAGDIGSDLRAVVAAGDGYWVANFHEWDVRRMSLTGDTLLRIADPPEWWEPLDDPAMEGFIDSSPAILDIAIDDSGRLLIIAGVPIPNQDAFEALRRGERSAALASAFADHVLRAYDAESGVLLAERRFDFFPAKFLNEDLAAVALPRGDSIVVEIHRASDLP